ncbi:hypothetical protein GCU49_20095, partial [Modestobacter roseus]|nr:hypothetical protein [Modestobacter roseus]
MQATRRPAPTPLRRRVTQGSVLGMGLLVATGAAAPVALAEDATTPQPAGAAGRLTADGTVGAPLQAAPAAPVIGEIGADFGTGKNEEVSTFRLAVRADDVPPNYSYAGATFRLRDGDGHTGTCTTDAHGLCTITHGARVVESGSSLTLPAGTYRVEQLTSSAGLARTGGDGELTIAKKATKGAPTGDTIGNASLFRRQVLAAVHDRRSALLPVPGAVYTLTAPAYPQQGTTPAPQPARDRSDLLGVLSWQGWFLPGEGYTLTPVSVPRGYQVPEATSFSVRTTTVGQRLLPWTEDLPLVHGSGAEPVPTPPVTSAPPVPTTVPSSPEPSSPEPTAPAPTTTAPAPTTQPEPTQPEPSPPVTTEPSAPVTTAPEPTATAPTSPEPTSPEPTAPETTVPVTTEPEPTVPVTTGPETGAPVPPVVTTSAPRPTAVSPTSVPGTPP